MIGASFIKPDKLLLAFMLLGAYQVHARPQIPTDKTDTAAAKPLFIKGVLSIYPDLPTGNLNVKWENQPKGIANVEIIDTADRTVLTATIKLNTISGNTQVDLSKLKQGDYTILITSEKISFTGRLSVLP